MFWQTDLSYIFQIRNAGSYFEIFRAGKSFPRLKIRSAMLHAGIHQGLAHIFILQKSLRYPYASELAARS